MKQKFVLTALFVALFVLSFVFSCKKNADPDPVIANDTPAALTPDTILTPLYFPPPIIPDDNKPSKELVQLGRQLYYDPILSNNGRSCASCHVQSLGFTVPGLYNNDMPVLPHVNLAWYNNFMWDGSKQGTLEDIMMFEVKDFFATDLAKVNQSMTYKLLFKKYYGVNTITYKELAYALAQFIRTLVSANTKYDLSLKGLYKRSPDEQRGLEIFFTEKGDCFHCHVNPVTTDNLLHNTGLDSIFSKESDKGYYLISGLPSDLGKFRTPNLRNVALRNRFMHDGRFSSLEEVIDFYDHGMHKVNNLDPVMSLPAKNNGLQLNAIEKKQLIAFLKTFTDSTFISSPKYANPY
jgi:cytochrome c peroxidase